MVIYLLISLKVWSGNPGTRLELVISEPIVILFKSIYNILFEERIIFSAFIYYNVCLGQVSNMDHGFSNRLPYPFGHNNPLG